MQIVSSNKASGKNEAKDFMGSSFKIGNENAFSYQSIHSTHARKPSGGGHE